MPISVQGGERVCGCRLHLVSRKNTALNPLLTSLSGRPLRGLRRYLEQPELKPMKAQSLELNRLGVKSSLYPWGQIQG